MICGLFQNQASTSGTLPSNTIPNPKGEMKAITTRSGVVYEGPSIPTNPSPKKVVERETKETKDKEQTNFQRSTAQIPPPVSIPELDVPNSLPKTTSTPESDVPKSLPKPNIPYPSRRDDQKSRDKASNQMEKIFQIFQDLRFDISFADALLLMPRFAPTIKSLLMNKEKLLELAKIPLNENCSAMLLKKLPEKLGDPSKFLIPCNFPGMGVCHALAYLGASINLMPLSIWKKLSLPELTPTRMTLELADRSITRPQGSAKIFLSKTNHALIDVYGGELVLRDGNEQITFHVDGTSKHPKKHINESIKMVNDTCKDSFKRFTDEPALVCLPPSKDVNDEKEKQEVKNLAETTAKRQTRITPCLKNFKVICKESIFHLNKTPQVSLVFAITSTLPSIEPKDSLIMGDEHLSTFSAEENVPIPRESEDTSRSDSKNVLPSCDDFSSINVPRDNFDNYKKFTDEPTLVCLPPSDDVNNGKEKQEVKNLAEPTAKHQIRITPCLKNFRVICKESIFHLYKTPQVSLVFAITSTLSSIKPKDSLIMGDEHLSTFSVEEIIPIPRESENTSRSDSKNVLPSCDDFSSINVPRDDSVTFSNPLFEFDVNFISNDINPLFDEVLEDIECKDSYYSNLNESTFLVTPLSNSNKYLAPGDDIEILLHLDPSTPMKSVASILEGFINDPLFKENDDLFDLECKTNDWKRILYDAPIDEAECFNPGGNNDEIDAFLAIKVPTYIEECYYDSEGDVIYLESLLSDDTTHNLSPEVFFDHEPQRIRNERENKSLITFSPKSDPLPHEFAGELITLPPRIVKEHEEYLNHMMLLCGNSSSRSPENSHTIIESLPTSTTLVEDSESNREEIDIFSGPDDSIPPGIESDFDSEEVIIDNLLNNDPIPEYERLTFDMEPDVPVINNVDELNEDE
ncbi:reverse transcriptase domain-containing protein, partial [Tanacetum coccineum]